MKTATLTFAASVVTAAALTPMVRSAAQRWGLVDHALTSRKIHGKPIPRLGGIAIVAAFYLPLLCLALVDGGVSSPLYSRSVKAFGLLTGGLIIAALGIWDDLRGANPRVKFAVQFGVAGLMYAAGYRIDAIQTPFGDPLHLGVLAIPFTVLWIAGVTNAMNLLDGLDGLAGGVAIIVVATTFVVALGGDRPLMVLVVATLGGAILGFLVYNFNPASIFMGDTGSMFLGFMLATTAIGANQLPSREIAIVVPVIALGIPIADTLLAMARRAARGVPMFSGDRSHIHHRLLDLGLSHRSAVLVLYGASVVLGLAALGVAYATPSQALYFLLALAGTAYLVLRRLGYVQIENAPVILEQRRRNMAMLGTIRRVARDLRAAGSLEDVWPGVRRAADALGASAVALHLPERTGAEASLSAGFDHGRSAVFRTRFSLLVERPGRRQLELGWSDGRTSIDRDMEIAVEILCDNLSEALDRMEAEEEPVLRNAANLRR